MATENDTGAWTKVRVERGIYKRASPAGDVMYFATVRTLRGTASGTFSTISKARAFLVKSKGDISNNRFFGKLAGTKLGVAAAVDRFIAEKGITHKTQLGRCRYWSDRFKDLPLLELDAARVSEALGELKASGLSGATVNRYKAALSGMWRHFSKARAGSERLVPVELNPARSVEKEVEAEGIVYTLDKAQRTALLAAAATDLEMLAAVRLSLTSGCRAGELAGLKWKDVNLTDGTAKLMRTKNGSRRAIAFDAQTVAAFRALPRGIGAAPVFSERLTDPNKRQALWEKLRATAGLPTMRWHDMRHVSVQVAIESGSTLMEAGLHTGHKSLAALARYSHLDPTHQKKIATRVGEAM